MYFILYKDTVLYNTQYKMDARANLFAIAQRRKDLEFWQEISHGSRTDFAFRYKDDNNEFEVYTIIKE